VTITVDQVWTSSSVDGAPGFITRYLDFVERKVASTRAAREISDELLQRIATGDLPPAALERGLNHFLQLNGADYGNAVVELSMQFLACVIRTGAEEMVELLDDALPAGVEQGTISIPEFEPARAANVYDELIAYAAEVRAAQSSLMRTALRAVARGDLDPKWLDDTASERSRLEGSPSVMRFADLAFEMITSLDELNSQFGMDYLRTFERHFDRPDAIELLGCRGESVAVRFVVSNDEADASVLQCAVSEVRREDGIGRAFDTTVEVAPGAVQLEPGAEAEVVCAVRLTDEYAVDATYIADIRVLSGTETILRLPLRIRVAPETPAS